ncbi:unnamed protein product, partial [Vitis vinifera]
MRALIYFPCVFFGISPFTMAAKPLTSEAIALTEKKMDMTLDDIIKMSKSTTVKDKKPRTVSRSQKFLSGIAQDKSAKMRRFMDSRSSLRQGVLAQRRSNFQANQFPLANEVARKAAAVPIRNRAFNRNRVPNWNRPSIYYCKSWFSPINDDICHMVVVNIYLLPWCWWNSPV